VLRAQRQSEDARPRDHHAGRELLPGHRAVGDLERSRHEAPRATAAAIGSPSCRTSPMGTRTRAHETASLLHVMARVSRALKASAEVALERHGVHAGQSFILERLWERDGQTTREIADAIGVEGPTAVRALQRMAAAGLVVRKDDPTDGRQVTIHLTAAGARLRTQLPRVLRQVEEHALANFSSADRTRLMALLERLSANVPRRGPPS
jgi:DNA-binding MarR family transcriptional regulator